MPERCAQRVSTATAFCYTGHMPPVLGTGDCSRYSPGIRIPRKALHGPNLVSAFPDSKNQGFPALTPASRVSILCPIRMDEGRTAHTQADAVPANLFTHKTTAHTENVLITA